MEGEAPPLIMATDGQLTVQAFGADPDAHAGHFKALLESVVPEQDITVQIPVIIVGSASVVDFAALQGLADLHKEDGAVLTGDRIFPLFGGHVRVGVLQLLGGDESHIGVEEGVLAQLRIHGPQGHLGGADAGHDSLDHTFQILQGPVLRANHLLPVPLVHIDAVQVVQFLVPANGVHVGVKTYSGNKAIVMEGLPLPLGQTMYHLGGSSGLPDGKFYRPLHTVQVVVEAGVGFQEKGSTYPVKGQGPAKVVLEQLLDQADGPLGVIKAQQGTVPLGHKGFAHNLHYFPLRSSRKGRGVNRNSMP